MRASLRKEQDTEVVGVVEAKLMNKNVIGFGVRISERFPR